MRLTPWIFAVFAAVSTLSTGCNQYEFFRVSGHEQASFSNDADILFVIDNSPSMYNEAAALGIEFNSFLNYLTDPDGAYQITEDLGDAVTNYVNYRAQLGRFLDYQLAITTTSANPQGSEEPGESGSLVGEPPVVSLETSDDVAADFRRNLLCEATCWSNADLPSDPTYEDGDPPGKTLSEDYMDYVCGGTSWEQNECGSGTEEGLESAFLALCRAVEDPPEECWYTEGPLGGQDREDVLLSNAGMLREGSKVIVVIISDEADFSRQIAVGSDDPQPYLDLYEKFNVDLSFAIIGPNYDVDVEHGWICNTGTSTGTDPYNGVKAYQTVAEETGGFYKPIAGYADDDGIDNDDDGEIDEDDECGLTSFGAHLEDLGQLMLELTNSFPLQSIPDPSSIRVYVDDIEADEAPCEENCEATAEDDPIYGSGWVYDASENAILFPEDPPGWNAEVRIYYRPLSGMPRSLPF
jgi:hypothetical protein